MVVHRDRLQGNSEGGGKSPFELARLTTRELVPEGMKVQGVPKNTLLGLCDKLQLPCVPELLDSCRKGPGIGVTQPGVLLEGAVGANPCDIELRTKVSHRAASEWHAGKKLRFGCEGSSPGVQIDITPSRDVGHFGLHLRFPEVRLSDDNVPEWRLLENVLNGIEDYRARGRLQQGFGLFDLGKEIPLSDGATLECRLPVFAARLEDGTDARSQPTRIAAVEVLAPTSITFTGLHDQEIRSMIAALGILGDWRSVLPDIRQGLAEGMCETTSLVHLRDNSAFAFRFVQWVTAEEVQRRKLDDQDPHANICIGPFATDLGRVDIGFEQSPKGGEFLCTIRWTVDEDHPDLVNRLRSIEHVMGALITDVCDRYNRPVPEQLRDLMGFCQDSYTFSDQVSEEIVSRAPRVVATVGRSLFSIG